jgi:7-cyano-7-deazaguanine synthase
MEFNEHASFFATGLHAGTAYGDCTSSFVALMQQVFDIYTDGICRVAAPFVEWTKKDIWDFCVEEQVPINLTYSCEVGGKVPCGLCLSCKDLEVLRAA